MAILIHILVLMLTIVYPVSALSSSWVGKIPLEKGMATYSSVLAWRIPWMEDPGGLQSTGLLRVRHD